VTSTLLLVAALSGAAKPAAKTNAPTATPASTRVLKTPEDEARWKGVPISLNLRDADLADVLRSIGELSGLNFVVYPEVRGTVTVSLTDVPWDQALDLILRINGYGYILEGKVVLVGPLARLADGRR
jgi:type IV pilus assembly protein PilQ